MNEISEFMKFKKENGYKASLDDIIKKGVFYAVRFLQYSYNLGCTRSEC